MPNFTTVATYHDAENIYYRDNDNIDHCNYHYRTATCVGTNDTLNECTIIVYDHVRSSVYVKMHGIVVTLIRPVEPIATRIKMKSRNQHIKECFKEAIKQLRRVRLIRSGIFHGTEWISQV